MEKGLYTSSGEGGIRTHGGPKGHNGFRDRPIQPLWHLSRVVCGGYYILNSIVP